MSYVKRPCSVCGQGIIQGASANMMTIGTDEGVFLICKECLYLNPTFRTMAATFILDTAEAALKKEGTNEVHH